MINGQPTGLPDAFLHALCHDELRNLFKSETSM